MIHRGKTNAIERFLGDWTRDKDFPDTVYLKGGMPVFADLVHRYAGEFCPGALLKILTNHKLIEVSNNRVTKVARAFIPGGNLDQIEACRHALRSLIGTVCHNGNPSEDEEPFLERRF